MEMQHKIVSTVFLAIVFASSVLTLMNFYDSRQEVMDAGTNKLHVEKVTTYFFDALARNCYANSNGRTKLCYAVTSDDSRYNEADIERLQRTDLNGIAGGDILVESDVHDSQFVIVYNAEEDVVKII